MRIAGSSRPIVRHTMSRLAGVPNVHPIESSVRTHGLVGISPHAGEQVRNLGRAGSRSGVRHRSGAPDRVD